MKEFNVATKATKAAHDKQAFGLFVNRAGNLDLCYTTKITAKTGASAKALADQLGLHVGADHDARREDVYCSALWWLHGINATNISVVEKGGEAVLVFTNAWNDVIYESSHLDFLDRFPWALV